MTVTLWGACGVVLSTTNTVSTDNVATSLVTLNKKIPIKGGIQAVGRNKNTLHFLNQFFCGGLTFDIRVCTLLFHLHKNSR